jgi:hypothetical protein
LLFRIFNGLMAICLLGVVLQGIKAITSKEFTYVKKRLIGERKQVTVTGTAAVVRGVQQIIIGGVLGTASLIGAVSDVNFIGIPINFFGGLLCLAPSLLPLVLLDAVLVLRKPKEAVKDRNKFV